jgi:hypothetical protein
MKLRTGLFCLLGGLPLTAAALGAGHFAWWWLSGILIAASFVPLPRYGSKRLSVQFAAMAMPLVIVGSICCMSEAYLFYPAIKPEFTRDLIGGSVQFLIVAAVLTLLIKLLKLSDSSAPPIEHRSPAMAIPMVLLSGLSYVIYYLVFGGITYQYFTKQYYPHAPEMAMALGLWFWVIQFTRGTLMTLSVLPAIYSMRVGRWQAALIVGLLIWIVGGAAPLVVPSPMMVTPQRYMHIVEIFTQNFALGVTAVLLLCPRAARIAAQVRSAATA